MSKKNTVIHRYTCWSCNGHLHDHKPYRIDPIVNFLFKPRRAERCDVCNKYSTTYREVKRER